MDASLKLIRLFKLYSVALKSFIDAQQNGAMDNIYLVLGDKAKVVTLKIPLAFIIGDNQGGIILWDVTVIMESLLSVYHAAVMLHQKIMTMSQLIHVLSFTWLIL